MSIVNDNFVTAESLMAHYKNVLSRTRKRPPASVVVIRDPNPPPVVVPEPVLDDSGIPTGTGAPNMRGARKTIAPILLRRGLVWADIIRDDRHKEFVLARREIYHALRELGWSYPLIAKLCKRDHTSVLYAIQKWAQHLSETKGKNHAND